MYRSITKTPSNKRVFGACLLSFMTLMAPMASVAAASPNYRHTSIKSTPAPGKASGNASEGAPDPNTGESLDAQEAALFLPAAGGAASVTSRFASASAGVNATSLFFFAAGDVTATMADSLVPADDVNGDTNVDPGDKITYTATITNPVGGTDASGLSFNVPLDSHTTLVLGSIQSTPVTFDKVVAPFNEDAAAQNIILQGQDPDGTNLTFSIVTSPIRGTLGSIGAPSCTNGVCSATVAYTPTANENGSDSFTFRVHDGTAFSNEVGTVSITINSVNDAPSFTAPASPAAVNEDVAGQTVTPFVTGISKGPANESGQTVDFVIDTNSHTALFAVQPAINASGTLTYTPAANANGTANITYHLHDNGGTANGGVDASSPPQAFTITVNAVNDAPVAQPKAFTVETNMKISGLTGLLAGVTDPDATNGAADPLSFDAAAPAYTTPNVTLANIAVNTCQNATPPATTSTVTITSMATGTFNFDPSPGMTGTCVLKYQVTDTGKGSGGNQTSAQADITITHTGPVIWFVDPNRATDGNGTLSDTSAAVGPFKLLSSANAKLASLAVNQRVFVYNTAPTVIGATEVLLLQGGANQAAAHWLIGQGAMAADFDTLFGINGTVPAGTIGRPSINSATRSTIRGTVNMRNNTRVEGVNIDVSGAAAGSKGLTNNAVALGAGSVLTIKDVNVTSAAGNAVDFTNGQTLTYTNSAGQVNIISSGTGIAVNMSTTTIGAGGMTFQSISSNGPTKGISLNTTGSGSFTVNGTGTTDGSGGTIQNATSRGAEFISANNITLKNMNFTNNGTSQTVAGSAATCGGNLLTGNNLACVSQIHLQTVSTVSLDNLNITSGDQMGINGNAVSAFSLANSSVTGNGNEASENGLTFQNLTGTCSITDTIIQDNFAGQVAVANIANSSTLTLGITGTRTNNAYPTKDTSTTMIGKTSVAAAGEAGVLFNTLNTSTNVNMTLNLTGVVLNNNYPANAVLLNMNSASGALGGTTTNCSFDRNGGGVILQMQNGQGGSYNVTNSEFNQSDLQSILYAGLNPFNSTLTGTIQGNTIGTPASAIAPIVAPGSACTPGGSNCTGIDVNKIGGTGSIQVKIGGTGGGQGNTVQQFDGNGIRVVGNGAGSVQAAIQNNTIQNPFNLVAHGIDTNIGTTAGATIIGCFNITGNTVTGTYENPGPGELALHTRVRFLAEHRLPGMAGAGAANAETFLNTNNPGVGGLARIFSEGAGVPGYQSGAACTTPLLFAEGGVESMLNFDFLSAGHPFPSLGEFSSIGKPCSANNPIRTMLTAPSLSTASLNQQQLDSAVSTAIARWSATGLTPQQVTVLSSVKFDVADLGDSYIGEASNNRILIDRNAGGKGWFIDPTPGDDSEFGESPSTTRSYTRPMRAPAGHVDLLTAIMHELGHRLGLDDTYLTDDRDSLMYGHLTVGERRLPSRGQAANAKPGALKGSHFLSLSRGGRRSAIKTDTRSLSAAQPYNSLAPNAANSLAVQPVVSPMFAGGTFPINGTGPATGFALPAGKTTTITFKVTVNNPPNFSGPSSNQVSQQGTLSGLVLTPSTVLTDDQPGTAAPNEPTLTTVDIFNTTTTLASSPTTPNNGQAVTYTATVAFDASTAPPSPAVGTAPTGTVGFFDNGSGTPMTGCGTVSLTGPVGNRTAQCNVSAITTGGHSVVAKYVGDGNFDPSNSVALVQTVNKGATTTTLAASSLNPSRVTQNITFTATVTANTPSSPAVTGTVTFTSSLTGLITCDSGQPLTGGVATCVTNDLIAGNNHNITANYLGDTNFLASGPASMSDNPQVVNKSDTVTVVTDSPASPTTPTTTVTYTATVTSQTSVSGPFTGSVTFKDAGVDIASCEAGSQALTTAGVATCKITYANTNNSPHLITAVYSGDSTFNASPLSAEISHAVVATATTTTLVSSMNPSAPTDTVTFTATVSATSGTPTGNVAFNDAFTGTFIPGCGSVPLTTIVGQQAVCVAGPGTFVNGTHPITAVYTSTTTVFAGSSSSPPLNQVVTTCTTPVVVTNTNDDLLPGSLRSAINTVCDNGTITFDPVVFATPQTITLTLGELALSQNVTITGPGAGLLSVSGNNASRVFNVAAGKTVVISGMTISNGNVVGSNAAALSGAAGGSAFGGGIYNLGTLTLLNAVVSNNHATGGIGGSSAGGVGGAGGEAKGGGVYSTGTVTLTNTTVNGNNSATGGKGGDSDTTKGSGGAGLGGGVYSLGSLTLTLTNSTISGNAATGGAIGGGTGSGGSTGSGSGGGIYNDGSTAAATANITGSTISGNTASLNGGGIFNIGVTDNATLNLTNSTISGNRANNNGGGIYNDSATGNTTLTSVTVTGNRADNDTAGGGTGGGINRVTGTVTLQNTIVGGNFVGGSPSTTADDIAGTVDATSSYNLIGDSTTSGGLTDGGANKNIVGNAGVGTLDITTVLNTTLANNGGPTMTHALVDLSPALDKGNLFSLSTDQRGFPRPVDFDTTAPVAPYDDADIGAFERQIAPGAPGTPDLQAGSDSGSSSTDNITKTTPRVFDIGSVTTGATVELLRDTNPLGGTEVVVASGVASGSPIALSDTTTPPDGDYYYRARQTLGSDVSPLSPLPGLKVTLDTLAPTAAVPDLQPGSDSGVNNDDRTKTTPRAFDIVSTENGATVELLRGGTSIATTTSSGGTVTLNDGVALADGPYLYTSRSTDVAGNVATSSALTVTMDTLAPATPGTPDLQAASDSFGAGTGGTDSDNITKTSPRLFDVAFTAELGSTIELLRDGTPVSGVGASASGASSPVTLTDADVLSSNTYLYSARITDATGNVSTSLTLSVTIDVTNTPAVPDLQAGSDSGASSSDNITKTTPRLFDITNTENGATVELYRGGVTLVDSTTGNGGTKTLTDSAALGDGPHDYTTKQTDVAGNVATSGILTVTMDTTPNAPGTPDLQTASDTGTSNTDNRTGNATHSFDITSESGDLVELLRNGSPVNSTTAGGASVTLDDTASLADATYAYTARQTDVAGNVATSASTLNVTIDTTAPAVLSSNRFDPLTTTTNQQTVKFTVTFSEDVTGVDIADFVTTATGGLTGTSVTGVTPVTASQYTVTVDTGIGDGNLRLDVVTSDGVTPIKDVMNISLATGFTTGEVYTISKSDPFVSSISRVESNPTNLGTVNFTVLFNKNVTGVDATDFVLATSGVTAPAILLVTGSNATYNVSVSTGTGDGTIGLNLVDDDSIQDSGARKLGGTGVTNGNFTGQVFDIDKTKPNVGVAIASGQANPATGPTATTVIHFTATFNEAVTAFDASDVQITGTSGASLATITEVAPLNGTTYDIGISGMTQSGNVTVQVLAGGAFDAAGNSNNASGTASVTYNKDDFTTLEVNTTADTDDLACAPLGTGNGCTLREAINAANADFGAETITFNIPTADPGYNAGTGVYTINLTGALADLSSSMTISGLGAKVLTVRRNTAPNYRIFTITGNSNVTIDGLTISNGNSTGLPNDSGGGILTLSSGTVSVTNSTISGNSAVDGGGIIGQGTGPLNITNSTISANSAVFSSGGIWLKTAQSVNITNSTISGNLADGFAGGIRIDNATLTITSGTITNNRADNDNNGTGTGGGIVRGSGTVTLRNTIVARNFNDASPSTTPDDIAGTMDASSSFNLIGTGGSGGLVDLSTDAAHQNQVGVIDPGLFPLADNGGNTFTHALQCVSPAIDKGFNFGATTDQRGGTRPVDLAPAVYPNAAGGNGSDIGAYEVQTGGGCVPLAVPPVPDPSTNEDTPVVITLTGTYSQNTPLTFTITQQPTHSPALVPGPVNCTFTTFQTCTATVTYSPSANYNGSDLFKFIASAGSGPGALNSDPADVNITVNAVNDPPVADSQSVLTAEDTPAAITLTGSDVESSITFSIVTGPAHGSFGATTAPNLIYTPDPDYNGPDSFTFKTNDGTVDSTNATVTITITAVNDAPTAVNDALSSVAEDSGMRTISKASLLANDLKGPANESTQTLTFALVAASEVGGTISSDATNVYFTPSADFNGAASFQYTVTDNGTTSGGADPKTSGPGTVSFTVTEVNDAPSAVNDVLPNIAEDFGPRTILASTLTGNDSKGPANESGQTLIVKTVFNPVGGTVAIMSGDVVFTPTANYNGPAEFTYTVEDNGTNNGVAAPLTSGPAVVQFNITVVNDAPTAVNDVLPNIAEDSGPRLILVTTIMANDVRGPADESGQTLTVKTVNNIEGGTVAIVAGDIVFTPTPNYNGPAIFSYTVEDNGMTNGVADPKTSLPGVVQFNITAVADTPSVTNATTNANTQTTSGLVISRNPVDGAEVTHFKITGISGGSLFKNDGVTPINNGNFITFAEGNAGLKFTPGTVNGSFQVQASTSASDAGLGGGTVQANIIINPLGGVIRFSSGSYSVGEGDGFKTITVERSGDTSQAVTVDYASSDHSTPADFIPCTAAGAGHASSRCDFTTAIGTLRFAAGEASKTFNVLVSDDNYVEGTETLDLTLSNPTNGAVFGVPQTAILSITDDASEPATNPIDISGEFVSQQYHDMLNREPDGPGLAFWTDNIEKCNDPARIPAGQTVPQCIDKQRESTAIAFFVSPEFQMGGGFVYHLYKGSLTGVPNYDGGSPGRFPTFLEFISDMSQVSEGIVVNNQISGAVVEANRNRLAAAFVLRPEFVAKYGGLNNTLYVDELFNTTGITPTAAEKQALVDGLNGGTETRASVLRKVVDGTVVISEGNVQSTTTYGQAFINQENRRLFVFMEYIGYLRRNPDAAGFNHWLGKLNFFNGDPFQAEMVRAFILSPEYRSRFGQP